MAYARLEKGIIAKRVRAGMARAKREGRSIGRRSVINGAWPQLEARLANGALSLRQAAHILGVGKSTVARQLSRKGGGNDTPQTQAQ